MVALAEQLTQGLHAKRKIGVFLGAEQHNVKYDIEIRDDIWTWYGGRVKDYDATFSRVLSALHLGSFREVLAARANAGLPTNVLDLMGGDASFLRDLKLPANRQNPSPLNAGLCVTLVDGRRESWRALDLKLNIEVLCGDLTSKNTWKLIDERQREMSIDAFDLIACRGGDGVLETMVPKALYPFLFGKIWDRLTSKEGLFITQLPETVRPRELLKQLRLIPGTRLSFQPATKKEAELYPSLGIVKTPTAPKSLI